MYKNILTENKDGILIITINRPDLLNSINLETLNEIEQAFEEIYTKEQIKGGVITGAGNKAFIAGADIVEFSKFSQSQGEDMVEKGQGVCRKIEECPKPIIAAVNGYALGGGTEIAMACHLRIGSSHAKFGLPEVKLGIIPGYGGTQRLHQLIGKSKAFELLLTGDTINAIEAEKIGLINYLVSPESLIQESLVLITRILKNSPKSIAGIINSSNAFYNNLADGYKSEIEEFVKCFGSPDFHEGTQAFISKRAPHFSGEEKPKNKK